MQALVSACWRHDWPAVHMHAGDVDWWTVHSLDKPMGLDEQIQLWYAGGVDESELVGFAWFGPPDEADIVLHPDHRAAGLVSEMADWFEGRLTKYPGPAGNGALRIWTVESELPTVAALAACGFEPTSNGTYARYCGQLGPLDLVGIALPGGFRFALIETEADIERRVEAGHAAFPRSSLTVEKYRFCRSTPLYRPELDTIVVADDGRIAAFALGWFDPETAAVELEPVGVAPDFWRRGLGQAVCRATLRTARDLGARQGMVGAESGNPASNALYASLGLPLVGHVAAFARRTQRPDELPT
jgi:GNAT superfamily N-acetyltransferase